MTIGKHVLETPPAWHNVTTPGEPVTIMAAACVRDCMMKRGAVQALPTKLYTHTTLNLANPMINTVPYSCYLANMHLDVPVTVTCLNG